jgi:hypothetical protein
MSLRQMIEERLREIFRAIGIPEEYARVTYGPSHPLYKGKAR